MSMSTTELADILKARQITSVCYFHADHFEPWSSSLNENAARGVERFGEMSRTSRFGRKLSLFYFPYVPYHVDPTGANGSSGRRVNGDAVVFGRRSAEQDRIGREVIRPLLDQHEFHLHAHHEWWTRNESNLDSPVSRWVNANSTGELDSKRLDLFFSIAKDVVSYEIGRPFDRWGFVHGNWALAASDPMICTIDDELRTIMRHGGFGDFSFPAGRGHCDPKLEQPFTCLPAHGKRAFEQPTADVQPIEAGRGALQPERFFIWNSPIKAKFSSLDYYYEPNRDLFRQNSRMVEEWLRHSVSFGNTLFIKTHAHSMFHSYQISQPGTLIPHCYPDVIKIFEELVRVCDKVGVEFRLVAVNEVMDLLHSHVAQLPSVTNDAAVSQVLSPSLLEGIRHDHASVVQSLDKCSPSAGLATPGVTLTQSMTSDSTTAFHEIAPLERELASLLTDWVRNDPRGLESAGDFYLSQIGRDHILQDYERAVFDYVITNFPSESTRIVEVGVGYGILSILLAATGYEVVAFEGSPLRLAGLQFLIGSMAERIPNLPAKLRTVCGWFPDALDQSMLAGDRRNVLVMTNVISTATDERQESILTAAGKFDELIIDTTRFGVQRYESDEEQLRASIAKLCEPMSSIWRKQSNEIWHFQPTAAAREASEVMVGLANSPIGNLLSESPMNDLKLFNSELLALQSDWIAGEGALHQPDDLFAYKMKRGVTLETYELAIAEAIGARFERNTTIVEIGSGYGAFALLLAQAGFAVQGFDGDRRRAAACTWHLQRYLERYPHLAGKVDFTPSFFPDRLPAGFGHRHGRRLGVATNITNTYTVTHQDAILYAARDFDEFIVDLARFGKSRDSQTERDALREAMAKSHFEPLERLYFAQPYEYWLFRIKPASRISVTSPTLVSAPESVATPVILAER
jgi:SAM-dependent methyltransferase